MTDLAFQSRDAIETHQLERLRELLRVIDPANPFQAARLRRAGVDAAVADLDTFRARVEPTVKDDLAHDQREHPPYGTNLTEPLEAYTRLHQTSSTTGAPLRWLDTAESWEWMLDGWEEVFRVAGVTGDDRVFLAFSFGPFIGLWMAFDAARRMGCLTIPGGGMNTTTRLRAILANEATVLCCTPTYALRLGEAARDESIDLGGAGVRAIVVGGEPGASVPAVRAKMEALWPTARLHDHHGMTEVGPVTHQCPARAGVLHVMEPMFLAEVVDPATGGPLAPGSGETGELVLTPLGRSAAPLLRYRTGDLVRPAALETCACGRNTLALEGGIIGRADDMVVVRGVNLYPTAIDQIIASHDEVAEYRVEISTRRSMTELMLEIEPAPACPDPAALCASVERALRDAYNLRIPVTPVDRDTLPRFELKAKRWIRTGSAGTSESGEGLDANR
jgi:phenylacetate-CoA ligase